MGHRVTSRAFCLSSNTHMLNCWTHYPDFAYHILHLSSSIPGIRHHPLISCLSSQISGPTSHISVIRYQVSHLRSHISHHLRSPFSDLRSQFSHLRSQVSHLRWYHISVSLRLICTMQMMQSMYHEAGHTNKNKPWMGGGQGMDTHCKVISDRALHIDFVLGRRLPTHNHKSRLQIGELPPGYLQPRVWDLTSQISHQHFRSHISDLRFQVSHLRFLLRSQI